MTVIDKQLIDYSNNKHCNNLVEKNNMIKNNEPGRNLSRTKYKHTDKNNLEYAPNTNHQEKYTSQYKFSNTTPWTKHSNSNITKKTYSRHVTNGKCQEKYKEIG